MNTRTQSAEPELARQTLEHDADPAHAPLERIQTTVPIPGAAAATNPMQMLAAALARGIDTPTLEKLMDLADRWEANEARKAYADAFAKFKKERIDIRRNKKVDYPTKAKDARGDRPAQPAGRTMYSHATLDHVCDQVIAKLSKHGFAHSWRPKTEPNKVTITTRITHRLGHFEEVTLEGPPDTSGSKNAIQAVGSTMYYLERYGLLAILGLAPKDADGRPVIEDDDGAGGAQSWEQQAAEHMHPAATSDGHEPHGTSARTEPGTRTLYVGEAPKRIIRKELTASGKDERALCEHFKIENIEQLPMIRVNDAIAWAKAQ